MTYEEFWRRYTLERHNVLNYSRSEYLVFVAFGICLSVLIALIEGNSNRQFFIVDRFLVYAKFVWLAYLPIALVTLCGILGFDPKADILLVRRKQSKDYKIIFHQIVTKGFNEMAVKNSARSVLFWAPRYLKNYEIWIVTEEDVNREFFESLKNISNEARRRVRIVYVPKNYTTPNDTKYKARALNYALELRRKIGYISDSIWIYLMDEESVVGEDTIIGIIDFVEHERKLIGQGLIVYSNFWGTNKLVSFEDRLRSADDISRYKLQTRIGKVFVGVFPHSHLLLCFRKSRIVNGLCSYSLPFSQPHTFPKRSFTRSPKIASSALMSPKSHPILFSKSDL